MVRVISGRFSVFSLPTNTPYPFFVFQKKIKQRRRHTPAKNPGLQPSSFLPSFLPRAAHPSKEPEPQVVPPSRGSRGPGAAGPGRTGPARPGPARGARVCRSETEPPLVSFVLPPWPIASLCLVALSPFPAAGKFEEIHSTLRRDINPASPGWDAAEQHPEPAPSSGTYRRLGEKYLLILYALALANEGRYRAIWIGRVYRRVFSVPHHHPHQTGACFLGNCLLLLHFTSPGR